MRGILFAWMRQSEKVESFKANQCPKHALHLKFDLHSGLVNDFEYPHLQIDVVSLYLIFLANFIASGLDIIYCMDEVTFIQNLVYYVERAYRTPDFGNWEPQGPGDNSEASILAQQQFVESVNFSGFVGQASAGDKSQPPKAHQHQWTNQQNATSTSQTQPVNLDLSTSKHLDGNVVPTSCLNCATNHDRQSLEIHATSIGMAKSALEAINGCNLFGGKGANWSIIYSDVDAHSRNRSIFETLLPRESRSKNTDSWLLATISWPCFATSDPALYNSTKSKIMRKLRGKYGFKRFLRDPYGTVLGAGQYLRDQTSKLADPNNAGQLLDLLGSTGGQMAPPIQSPSISFESARSTPMQRQTSFGSTTSLGSAGSLSVDHQAHQQQPKVKLRKSSYFQRKTNIGVINSNVGSNAGGNIGSSIGVGVPVTSANQHERDSFYSSCSSPLLQRTESTSAKMSKRYEHIESEWPLFVCFLIIDGIFKNNLDQVYENEKLLYEKLLKIDTEYGDYLMPKYYFVPLELINSEKCHPDSVERLASPEGSSRDRLYLTGQAILLITRLLLSGLVHSNELDPLHRHQPSHDRPKRTIGRYSSFQSTSPDLVVQTVLIAESIRLQAMMANYGIQTQTPREVEPVQIWSSAQLVKVYEYLGVNQKLGLKGRPARPIGALGTSKLYRICGQTIICYPLIFEVSDFYLAQDMLLLIDDIQNELNFIGRYWRMSGRPTVCIIIREEHLKDVHFRDLLDLLVQFKNGQLKKSGLRIKTGRLQNLISSSCIEHLDFLHLLPHEHLPQFESFKQLVESPKQSLLLAQRQKRNHKQQNQQQQQSEGGPNATTSHRLNVARYSSQQQQQQRQHDTEAQEASESSGDHFHSPTKTRRRLLCSASSHNLQAIEENCRQNSLQEPSTSDSIGCLIDGDDFHSMVLDEYDPSCRFLCSPGAESVLVSSEEEEANLEGATSAKEQQTNINGYHAGSMGATSRGNMDQQAPVKDYYECYKEAPTWPTLIELLRTCTELSGQSQLLAILWEREGAKYCVDDQSIERRLERLGALACQTRNWSVVRYCSAVLRRSVESLSPWLTSILVNGKQISLGQGQNEKIINNPLTPTEIHTLIYSTVSTKNPCDAVLQQEIALYIGRLISTRPDYFEGILTIRVANFMSAMRSYLSIKNNERRQRLLERQRARASANESPNHRQHNFTVTHEDSPPQQQQLLDLRIKTECRQSTSSEHQQHPSDPSLPVIKIEGPSVVDQQVAPKKTNQKAKLASMNKQAPKSRPLESLSPSEVRRLLVRVLTDDQSLPISDRRQITGELCRVPRDFYDKVWSLLHFTNVGIVIGQRILKSVPILTNMTQDDLNFALKVESILSSIVCPKLRQINVEFLMALHEVFERNPELRFDTEPLDLDKIINLSLEKFRQDNGRADFGLQEFYSMTTEMAMLYTIRTVFDCLLPTKYKGRDELQSTSTAKDDK